LELIFSSLFHFNMVHLIQKLGRSHPFILSKNVYLKL